MKFFEGFIIGKIWLKFIVSLIEIFFYWLVDFIVVNCMLMLERVGRDIDLLDRKYRG